jgi:hypothetical protein
MPNWLIRLREVVWVAVIAAVFAILAVIIAIFFPAKLVMVFGFGFASITFAILAQRV